MDPARHGGGGARRSVLRALALSWLANTLLGSAIGTLYFGDALAGLSWKSHAFAGMALVSSVATVLLVPWLPLALAGLLWPARRGVGVLHGVLATLSLLVLFADTRVWALFRYHMNGMVWNVLTTPGGADTFQLGAQTWALVALAAAAILALELALWFRLLWPATAPSGPERRRRARALKVGLPVLLGVVALEKGLYAAADVVNDREISSLARLFPLYQPVTAKRTLSRLFGVRAARREEVQVAAPGLMLRYPHARPRIDPSGARPNVLIVLIDSLRSDALAPETMPRAWRWTAERARRFDDHASGGNATRFGIFSLVYGIHGSYWPAVYAERTPPVLVTELDALGYDLRVISACGMTYPEFRSTAWVSMQDRVEDDLPSRDKWRRDEMVGERFAAWLDERAARGAKEPFFAFTLLDGPHQDYDWPRERTAFRPYLDKVNYLKMASNPSPEEVVAVRNSWRNAVLHDDDVFGRMLDALEQRGLTDSTLVIVTGDHGEEFFEHGLFGHTSDFTRTQAQVTFALGGPGVPHGVETRPTCHIDVPVTILELLGADPAGRADWAQGENLLAPPATRERVVAGWQEVAVWVDGGILHVPLEGHKGLLEPMSWDWKPHPEGDAFLARHGAAVARLARECRAFLR